MAKKVAGNVSVTYNSVEITNYLNTASLNGVVNAIDTTDFGDENATTSIAGLGDWEVPVGGPWDATLDAALAPDVIAPPATLRTLVVVIDTVTFTVTTNAFITGYTINASAPSDGITWSGTLKISGAPVRT